MRQVRDTKWLTDSDESSRVVLIYLTSNPFLSVVWPKSTKTPWFYFAYRCESEHLRNACRTRPFQEGPIEEKKKKNMILCWENVTSYLKMRSVIHTRLTTPVQSTIAARSDSVTSWTKEKGNVRKFNHHRHHHHRHHYSRKDVFPQERGLDTWSNFVRQTVTFVPLRAS